MNVSDLMTLYDHNYWTNRRILAAAAQLSPEEFGGATESELRKYSRCAGSYFGSRVVMAYALPGAPFTQHDA